MKIKRVLTTVLFTLTLVVLLQGCNTIEGMGEDVEQAGQEVEEAAE